MKKLFSILTMIFILTMSGAFAYQMRGNAKTHRIPRGQKLELKLIDPITTQDVQEGDIFSASLTKDIIMDGEMVLPMGSLVRGTVGHIKPTRRLSRSAVMFLTFDHVVDPTGQQLPIKAGVCSDFKILPDGSIAGGGNYGDAIKQNWSNAIGLVKKSTNWGINSGEKLFKGGKYLLTPFAAIGGVIGGTFYYIGDDIVDLFKKGNDIVINQGTIFNIMLLDNLDIPIW